MVESTDDLLQRNRDLQDRLEEAEETLRALRHGEVDAVVASGPDGDRVYTLKGADEAYRIMVESMAEGAVTVTFDGVILFSNEQFARLVGTPLERVIGSSIHNFIAAEDHSLFGAFLSRPPGIKAEILLTRQPAATVPVQIAANRLLLDGLEHVCLIVTDLSQQKRHLEIAAAEHLARSILDQTAGAILVVDPAGRIIRASRAAQRMANGSVLLHKFDGVFSLRANAGTDTFKLDDILASIRSAGPIGGLELRARMPDGRILDVLMNASVLTGAKSEFQGCIVLLHDISALKRAEQSTRQISEQRGLALEAGKLGSWEYRFDCAKLSCDLPSLKMFGLAKHDHIDYETALSLIHADDREAVAEAMRRALEVQNSGTFFCEFRVVWPDNSVHWLAAHAQAYFEGCGDQRHPVRMVGVNQEITGRKQAEEARQEMVRTLELAVSEKTVLLKEIHHRVKNNLAVIASLLRLKADATPSAEAKLALMESQHRVHSMALIHEHLYGTAYLDRIKFAEYVGELAQGLLSFNDREKISIEMDFEPIQIGIEQALPCALILNELLTNAFKYAFPGKLGGRVRISFHEPEPGWLNLMVEDNGVGLPAGSLKQENIQSLGLQIVGILTEQLGGTLEQQPCSGTRIVLRFPAVMRSSDLGHNGPTN